MQLNYLTQNSLFPHSRPTFNSLQRTWTELTETVMVWMRRYQHRQELRELLENDQRFFSDIGISRATFYKESVKWFWEK